MRLDRALRASAAVGAAILLLLAAFALASPWVAANEETGGRALAPPAATATVGPNAPTGMTIIAVPNNLNCSNLSIVTASLKDGTGKGVGGIAVTFSATSGTITSSATTDSNGNATASYVAPSTPVVARVTASGAGFSVQTEIRVNCQATPTPTPPLPVPAGMSLLAIPNNVACSNLSIVTATLKASSGAGVAGVPINYSTSRGTITSTATTDNNGNATASFVAPSTAGSATITASGGGFTQATNVNVTCPSSAGGVVIAPPVLPTSTPAPAITPSPLRTATAPATRTPLSTATPSATRSPTPTPTSPPVVLPAGNSGGDGIASISVPLLIVGGFGGLGATAGGVVLWKAFHPRGPRAAAATSSVGPYELLQKVGQGGMGSVYRARDSRSNGIVALKLLHPHLVEEADYVTRFQREARLASRIDSPHVVKVLDSGSQGGVPYLVMEYVDGTNLAEVIRQKGVLAFPQAASLAGDIARGLAATNAQGVVHRDVSPQNVMLTAANQVKVTDFGIARLQDSRTAYTRTGIFMGKPQYMAPESLTGRTKADTRSDIYSLGVILYEVLSGRPPFDGDSPWTIVQKQLYEPPPSLRQSRPDVPVWLESIIDRCLAKRPEERFQTPQELIDALDRRQPERP